MSRSRPTEHAPNPARRWFEWQGELGTVRYYDKDVKQNVDVGLPFTFLLLDELATVRGWHDASESAIYANEVKDTRKDVLIVKAFKGGTLAEGLYQDIKDRIGTLGAKFTANCYVAFKDNGALVLGALRFQGAALGAWMEFRKTHRYELYEQAVEITGFSEGKKGRITFRVPTFRIKEMSADTRQIATAIDKELQTYLDGYFARRVADRTPTPESAPAPEPDDTQPLTDDEIPFAWLLPLALPMTALLGGLSWV